MLSLMRNQIRQCGHLASGGMPGSNLPFRKGIENPMRFTVFYLVVGLVGFGAPWLVFRHQMLRTYTEPPPPEDREQILEDKKDD